MRFEVMKKLKYYIRIILKVKILYHDFKIIISARKKRKKHRSQYVQYILVIISIRALRMSIIVVIDL